MRAFEDEAQALIRVGREAFQRGWVPATSGNFSARLGDGKIAITVSGRHKGYLSINDIMRVDREGAALDDKTPSAETLLHISLYRRYPDVQSVLHTHSVNATVLSKLSDQELVIDDMEVLKAFSDINTHSARIVVPVFANDQDIGRLAAGVERYLDNHGRIPGYLIAGHGLYTWGESVSDSMRHLEAFEFLFECELAMRRVKNQ